MKRKNKTRSKSLETKKISDTLFALSVRIHKLKNFIFNLQNEIEDILNHDGAPFQDREDIKEFLLVAYPEYEEWHEFIGGCLEEVFEHVADIFCDMDHSIKASKHIFETVIEFFKPVFDQNPNGDNDEGIMHDATYMTRPDGKSICIEHLVQEYWNNNYTIKDHC